MSEIDTGTFCQNVLVEADGHMVKIAASEEYDSEPATITPEAAIKVAFALLESAFSIGVSYE